MVTVVAELGKQTGQTRIAFEERMDGLQPLDIAIGIPSRQINQEMLCASK
jgi:hypothetical protein